MTPPFSAVSKSCGPPSVSTLLLISDKSLSKFRSSFFLSSSKQMKRAKNYGGYMESSKKVINGGVFQLQIFQAFFH